MFKKYTLKFSKDYNKRNFKKRDEKFFNTEPLTNKIVKIIKNYKKEINVLEIGSGNGDRIEYLKNLELKNLNIFGVDPTYTSNNSKIGVTYNLPFENNFFDLIYYGFCLYMVKPEDLAKSLYEADRVLKKKSWVIIYDFYSKHFIKKNYKHFKEEIIKMDYSKMFTWIPNYAIESQILFDCKNTLQWTDDKDELLTLLTIRKYQL